MGTRLLKAGTRIVYHGRVMCTNRPVQFEERPDFRGHGTLLLNAGPVEASLYAASGFRCQECGSAIPTGRRTCRKCGSADIDLA